MLLTWRRHVFLGPGKVLKWKIQRATAAAWERGLKYCIKCSTQRSLDMLVCVMMSAGSMRYLSKQCGEEHQLCASDDVPPCINLVAHLDETINGIQSAHIQQHGTKNSRSYTAAADVITAAQLTTCPCGLTLICVQGPRDLEGAAAKQEAPQLPAATLCPAQQS
jgi:hypothetical protein